MAMVLVKRALTQQAYATYSVATPGNAGKMDFGTLNHRPYGPKLAGWPLGWSAHNSSANARIIFDSTDGVSFQNGSQETTCGCVWAVFKLGPVGPTQAIVTPGTDNCKLIAVTSAYGGASDCQFWINVKTMVLQAIQDHSRFPEGNQTNLRTLLRHNWFALGVGWQLTQPWDSSVSKWTLRFQYIEPGMAQPLTLFTSVDANFLTSNMAAAHFGTLWENNADIAARIGLASLYSMTSIADMTFPAEIAMPANPTWADQSNAELFHVASSATGGGNGTTQATAWTTDEARAEMASNNYTVTSGAIVDSGNNQIDTKTLDANVLKQRMSDGTYKSTGCRVYYSDDAGPLRWISNSGHQLKLTRAIQGSVHAGNPALGRGVDNRRTLRHTSGWVLHQGSIYKKNITSDLPIVWEFDSAAKADVGDERRYLAHPTAANLAAYIAAATAGSFWSDGTTVYLWPSDSGNPNSNGKVYEVTYSASSADGDPAGADMWTVTGQDITIQDITLRLCGAVNNTNQISNGGLGRCLTWIEHGGMCFVRRVNLRDGTKHNHCFIPARNIPSSSIANHSRLIFIDSPLNDCGPTEYTLPVTGGGQSIMVEDGNNDGDDGQFYYENVVITTNTAVIGSTVGTVDTRNSTMLQHNGGSPATAIPMSKGWVINCVLPGLCNFGTVTAAMTISGTACGSAATDIVFGAQSNTLTSNRILCRSMSLGAGLNPSAAGTHTVRSNLIVASGTIATTGTVIGTVNFRGNTIDATALAGGTTKAIFTRGGVLHLSFASNIVLLNNSDSYRLIDTFTPASGDALDMGTNRFGGNDSSRILITSYGGATETLAQLQSLSIDLANSSAFATDMKINPVSYALTTDSAAHNAVDYSLGDGNLAVTADLWGRLRPPIAPGGSGNTDAGAIIIYRDYRHRNFDWLI